MTAYSSLHLLYCLECNISRKRVSDLYRYFQPCHHLVMCRAVETECVFYKHPGIISRARNVFAGVV